MNFKFNKALCILKCLYFLEISIVGCLFIYMAPFMSECGITASEMAVINLVANISSFFSRPFFGFIADKYQKYKQILILLNVLSAVVFSLNLASPRRSLSTIYSLNDKFLLNVTLEQNSLVIYTTHLLPDVCWPITLSQCQFNDRSSSGFNCSLEYTTLNSAQYGPITGNVTSKSLSSLITCGNIISTCNNTQRPFKSVVNNVGLTWSSTFWYLSIAKTIGFVVYSPLVSLTDAVTFVTLGPGNANKYGSIRMFGAIGVLVVSLVMAGILHLVSVGTWGWIVRIQVFSQFTSCFIMAAIIFALIIVATLFLRTDKPIKSVHFMKSFNILVRDVEIGIFFLFATLGGFSLQVFGEYFYLILFKRYSTLPKFFPGLIIMVMTISESAFFGFSSYLLRYKSHEILISVSFLAWSLRWFSYIFVENFWLLLVTEILHGPSFGLMLSSMMSYIGKVGTKNTQGRIQGLFSGIYFNIGGALGGLVGGVILDQLGMFGLFKVMSAISLVCGLYYPIQKVCVYRLCKSSTPTDECIKIDSFVGNGNEKPLLLSAAESSDI